MSCAVLCHSSTPASPSQTKFDDDQPVDIETNLQSLVRLLHAAYDDGEFVVSLPRIDIRQHLATAPTPITSRAAKLRVLAAIEKGNDDDDDSHNNDSNLLCDTYNSRLLNIIVIQQTVNCNEMLNQ